MRKTWKWIKKNKFATFVLFCCSWALHYSIETFVVQNVLKLAGVGFPVLAVI